MINREIKSSVVKVVSDEDKKLTQMSLEDAIRLAEESGYDVVCLNDKENIPIVKIMDYGKFQYEKTKRDKDNKKKARLKAQDTKEIIISDSIAEHDLIIKANNVDRLIKEGNRVRLTIKYKGRTIRMIGNGPARLQSLVSHLKSEYKIESTPKIEGNKVSMSVIPFKK